MTNPTARFKLPWFQVRLGNFLLWPLVCLPVIVWLTLSPDQFGRGTRTQTLEILVIDADTHTPISGASVQHNVVWPPIATFSTDETGRAKYTYGWNFYQDRGLLKWVRNRVVIDYRGSFLVSHPGYEPVSQDLYSLTDRPEYQRPNPPPITIALRRKKHDN